MLSAPGKADGKRPGVDCRVYERQSCELPATCQPASAREMREQRWTATIVDISQGGVRIHVTRRFERGTPLAIELPSDGANESSVVFAKVVHVRAEENGQWALGCKFISDLDEDEVFRLAARQRSALPPEANGRQQSTKAPTAKRILDNVAVEIDTGIAAPRQCLFKRLDVTKAWPLAPGNTLSIHGKTKDGTDRAFHIEIVSASQLNGQWRLRGRFAKNG